MRSRRLKPPLRSRPSWWLEEARAHRPTETAPPLSGEIEVDVAIVGGGYTGLWTALALREREPSLSVALLEAREIGDGPSGRNGGFLHGYWSSLPTLRRVLGDGAALQLAHASSQDRAGGARVLRAPGRRRLAARRRAVACVGRGVRGLRCRARRRGGARRSVSRRRRSCSMRTRRGALRLAALPPRRPTSVTVRPCSRPASRLR